MLIAVLCSSSARARRQTSDVECGEWVVWASSSIDRPPTDAAVVRRDDRQSRQSGPASASEPRPASGRLSRRAGRAGCPSGPSSLTAIGGPGVLPRYPAAQLPNCATKQRWATLRRPRSVGQVWDSLLQNIGSVGELARSRLTHYYWQVRGARAPRAGRLVSARGRADSKLWALDELEATWQPRSLATSPANVTGRPGRPETRRVGPRNVPRTVCARRSNSDCGACPICVGRLPSCRRAVVPLQPPSKRVRSEDAVGPSSSARRRCRYRLGD